MKNKLASIALILVLAFTQTVLYAQSCADFNYSYIILDVVARDTKTKIDDLKITLCDGDGTAFLIDQSTEETQAKKPYMFWQNKTSTFKGNRFQAKHARAPLAGLGNYYVCKIPSYTGANDLIRHQRFINLNSGSRTLSAKTLFLYVKIESRATTTQIVQIPSNHFYNACDIQSHSGFDPIQVKPIVITLSDSNASVVSRELFGVIPVTYTAMSHTGEGFDQHMSFDVKNITLIDEFVGKQVQVLPDKKVQYKNRKTTDGALSSLGSVAAYNKFQHVLVPAKITDSNIANKISDKNSYIVYVFDTQTQRYQIDSVLSWPDFLKEDKFHQAILGTCIQVKNDTTILSHYKLSNTTWELQKSDTTIVQRMEEQVAPTPQKPKPNCIYVQATKRWPLKFYDTSMHQIVIRDTFYLVNTSTVDARLSLYYPTTYYKFPKEIKAQQTVPIYYERTINNALSHSIEPIFTYEDPLHLTYDSGKYVTAIMLYSIVNNMSRLKETDSCIVYTLKLHEFESYETRANFKGEIIANGKKVLADDSKLGPWRIYNAQTGGYDLHQFQKVLFIYNMPGNADFTKCIIKVIDSNGSTKFATANSNTNARVYVAPSTRKVVIYNDSQSAEYIVPFDQIQQQEVVSMELLRPGDLYYYQGTQKFAFHFKPTQYHIRWYNDQVSRKKDWDYLQALQERFPKLIWIKMSKTDDLDIIDLANYTMAERQDILSQLQNDDNVDCVAQMWANGRATYCDNRVYLYTPNAHYKIPDERLKEARSVGFHFTGMHNAPSQSMAYFEYDKKIIDEAFFRHFNELVEVFNYQKIFLSVYTKVQLDNKLDPSVFGIHGW
ncbi:MAG: hypothetical protein RL660_2017 [Bacteroidota bacterium]|jgi:hypothetical protein